MATKLHLALGASCALAFSFPLSAQQPVFPGGETIVTATRLAQPLAEALRNVTIITAEEIERSGQLTLAQVLQQLGGLEMVSNGGHGNAASILMRGSNAAHTLVLVDGIRLQSATVGTTAFENIPLSQVERIEIVPGPVSSLYGSDAIGGVIQVFTKGGAGPRASVTASVGTQATRALKASASTTFGDTDVALSAGAFRTDNFNVTRPTISFGRFNPDIDPYRNDNFSAKVAHRPAPGHELGASAFFSDGEASFDNGPIGDHRTEQKLSVYSAYSRNRFLPTWESLVRVGASRDDSSSLGDPFPADFRTDQVQATWQNTFTLAEHTKVVGGYEHLVQKVDTSTPYDVTRRTIRAFFAGVNGEYGAHAVQASLRRDDNSQFGSPTTGSVAYGFDLTPAWRLRGSYGTAFHAPSFNDLYFPGFGNAGLVPERSRNREVGIDWHAAGHRFAATYFDNRIRDLIVFVFDTQTFEGRPENVDRARIRGTELSYNGAIGATRLRAKLTLQDPESESTGLLLQRRARRHGSVAASHGLGAWRVGAEVVASGERFDSPDESPASRLAGYALVNLSVGRDFGREWAVDLRWNNVADRDYELIQGFNTPGSNVLLSVRWTPRP
ncbi:MAG TPA: TonB-dependent receptor [Usitatibacter sp.]|nr:TonB-dependent receptor [Usitatibacter sp.]